ncbi:MAG: coproporphyrinogen III oxidase family protein [Proteobacteria bacterium]|nr:coproporphyrinogen III oxidase family protein [Pseudomonadota bacterium]
MTRTFSVPGSLASVNKIIIGVTIVVIGGLAMRYFTKERMTLIYEWKEVGIFHTETETRRMLVITLMNTGNQTLEDLRFDFNLTRGTIHDISYSDLAPIQTTKELSSATEGEVSILNPGDVLNFFIITTSEREAGNPRGRARAVGATSTLTERPTPTRWSPIILGVIVLAVSALLVLAIILLRRSQGKVVLVNDNISVAEDRNAMWEMWTTAAKETKDSLLVVTRTVGRFAQYIQVVESLDRKNLDLRLLAPPPINDPDKLESLIERKDAGFEVKLRPELFSELPFRYQLVDKDKIVLNIPSSGNLAEVSTISVSFKNEKVAEGFIEEFNEQWEDEGSQLLYEYIMSVLDQVFESRPNKEEGQTIAALASSIRIGPEYIRKLAEWGIREGFLEEKGKDRILRKRSNVNGTDRGSVEMCEQRSGARASKTAESMAPLPVGIEHRMLIQEAREFLSGIDSDALRKVGVRKSLDTSFWPGHTIVTYPFYDDLEEDSDKMKVLDRIQKMGASSINLYVHIPYCTGICEYCAYSKSAGKDDTKKKHYIEAVDAELSRWADHLQVDRIAVDSIYIGGGTPTSLPLSLFRELLSVIQGRTTRGTGRDVEATCEASPETLLEEEGRAKLSALRASGFNRISLGVQSFSDSVLRLIGRRHGRDAVLESMKAIKNAGFEDSFNIDLMYGLPQQDPEGWLESLAIAASLDIPSITLYPFKLKKRSVWSKRGPAPAGWSSDKVLLLARSGKKFLESKGYSESSVYWFLKDSKKRFKQQGEKHSMRHLLGVGCSAYSYVAGCQFYNSYKERDYVRAIKGGGLALDAGRPLETRELMVRHLIFGIRGGLSRDDFHAQFHADPIDEFSVLASMQDAGLIELAGDALRLTEVGSLFSDEIGLCLHMQCSGD